MSEIFDLLGLAPRSERMPRGSLFFVQQVQRLMLEDLGYETVMENLDQRAREGMLKIAAESGVGLDMDTFHRHSAIAYAFGDVEKGEFHMEPIEHSVHGRQGDMIPADTVPDIYEVFWNVEPIK